MGRLLPALSILALVVAAGLPGGCGSDGKPGTGPLIVGCEPEFEPFEYRNPDGDIIGFDPDLAALLAQEMGRELRIESFAWDAIIAALQQGKCDIILSGMSITEERRKRLSFSEPYYRTKITLLMNRSWEGKLTDVAQLDTPDVVIAVKRQTTGHTSAQKHFPHAVLRIFDSENECALEVSLGRADAFIYDAASIRKHAAQHAETTFVYPTELPAEDYGIAVRKEDPELLAEINAALARIKADGRYDALLARYARQLGLEPSSEEE